MSPNNKSKGPWPVCHTCGVPLKSGWKKCHQISKKLRANITKLIRASIFDRKSGGGGNHTTTARTSGRDKSTKQKKGTENEVVEEENDGEETEAKEGKIHTKEHLLQMLGMSNTLADYVNNTEEPATKAEGCWDGDTLAHLGFTNIQVGGTGRDADHEDQDQGVLFAEAE